MPQRTLHQFTAGVTVGDAISDHLFTIQGWLRAAGFHSEIYAQHINPRLADVVRPALSYRPSHDETYVIYHHSIGSPLVAQLTALPLKLLLIYHNITPPEFIAHIDPALTRELREGLEQLALLRPHTILGLGVSPFNESELHAAGFTNTGVLPIVLDESQYHTPHAIRHTTAVAKPGPLLLFVGRLTPHKRQEDLIKLLYYYRRIEPSARLALVGSTSLPAYRRWLQSLVHDLGLDDHVDFAGHVSQAEMVSYFRTADLYVSMSEHEGFGKPLIESMYLDLPVLAYGVTSVPGTLGGAGVLFRRKEYEVLAEVVDLLVKDQPLRLRIIARQRARVQAFLEPQVKQQWERYLSELFSGE
jgi:glycosyltransferase involved in cell wall biosynthesis